jgi:vacuolar iron transporter family protein
MRRHGLERRGLSACVKEATPAAPSEGKTLDALQAEHTTPPRSRLERPPGELSEQRSFRNYVRDLILGFNDGVVSIYAACAGLAGAGFSADNTGVAGAAAAVAGALSMGLGEFVSTQSQMQYYEAEAKREREHIKAFPQLERQELKEMLVEKGYPPDLVGRLVTHFTADEDRFVEFMMREEFGIGKEAERSPMLAAFLIALAFIVGSALPVLPFFLPAGSLHLGIATAASVTGLFAAGAAKGVVSGISWLRSGTQMALLGTVAAAITYGIGSLFHIQA